VNFLTSLTCKKNDVILTKGDNIMQFIEKMDIEKLKLWEKNPRFNDEAAERLAKVLKKHGFIDPVIIDENNIVRAGNTRVKAAKLAGIKSVPALIVNFKNEQAAEAYSIANNKANEWAQWDYLGLKEIIDSIGDYDFEDIGFTKEEYDDLFNRKLFDEDLKRLEQGLAADNEEFQENVEAISKLNDIWLLGRHRLMCGDSTKKEDIERLIDGTKIDGIYTDPPYGINVPMDNSKRRGIAGGRKYVEFKDDSNIYAAKAIENIKDLNIKKQVWWGANNYCHYLPQSNNWLIWDKKLENDRSDTNSDGEMAWVLDGHQSIRIFRHQWRGMIKASESNQKRVHPTQKPIALALHCFDRYDFGKNVLDLFGGSGSTLLAAEQSGRTCFMMEIVPYYVDVIIKRYIDYKKSAEDVFVIREGEKFSYSEIAQ